MHTTSQPSQKPTAPCGTDRQKLLEAVKQMTAAQQWKLLWMLEGV